MVSVNQYHGPDFLDVRSQKWLQSIHHSFSWIQNIIHQDDYFSMQLFSGIDILISLRVWLCLSSWTSISFLLRRSYFFNADVKEFRNLEAVDLIPATMMEDSSALSS